MPRVQVLMPARNEEAYVADAVISVLSQTLRDFSLVVVDDCSEDNTAEIAQSVGDERLAVRRLSQPVGDLGSLLNAAASEGDSEFIARMDADDLSLPWRLRTQVALLEAEPATVVLGSAACAIDAAGRPRGFLDVPSDPRVTWWQLGFRNPMIHGSVLARRGPFEAVGGYRSGMHGAEDYDLFVRLSELGDVRSERVPLVVRRLHQRSTSTTLASQQGHLAEKISEAVLARRGVTPPSARVLSGLRNYHFSSDADAMEAIDFLRDYAGGLSDPTLLDAAAAEWLWIAQTSSSPLSVGAAATRLTSVKGLKLWGRLLLAQGRLLAQNAGGSRLQ